MNLLIGEELDLIFRVHGDLDKAAGMRSYMKDRFQYYGINSPLRKQLTKEYFKEQGYPDPGELESILQILWQYDEREMQYVGIDLVRRLIKKQGPEFIHSLEEFILRKSWWDTVDALSHDAGTLLQQYPDLQPLTTDRWIKHESFWLRRAAVIHQLKWKEKTHWERLQDYILQVAHEKEFFLRKACGWALREYSKSRPDRVQSFIEKYRHHLSGLTIREGSKYLKL